MDEKMLEQAKAEAEAAKAKVIEFEQREADRNVADEKAKQDLATAMARAVELEQALEAKDVAELEQKLEGLVAAGKVSPAMAKQLAPVLVATRGKVVDFDDKKGESATATLLDVLESLPGQIDFAQIGRPGGGAVAFTRQQIQAMPIEEYAQRRAEIDAAEKAGLIR